MSFLDWKKLALPFDVAEAESERFTVPPMDTCMKEEPHGSSPSRPIAIVPPSAGQRVMSSMAELCNEKYEMKP